MAVIIYLKDVLKKTLTQSSHIAISNNEAPKSSKSGGTTKTRITRKASTLCSSLVKRKTKQQKE